MANSRPPENPIDVPTGALPAGDAAGAETGGGGEGDVGRALGIAYAYLNRRERTVAEIRARLQRAELSEQAIEAAVAELVEFGYLDDRRYARVFAEDKRNLDQWGRDRIERALRDRGVERDLIEAAVAGVDGQDELARAFQLLTTRFPAGPGDRRDRERAFGVLARKGYESEIAADAVRSWAAAANSD